MDNATVVVTGAFGYTGKYITKLLLDRGYAVRTLTGHPDRPNPFGPAVRAFPFNFEKPAELVKSLTGAATLYNTYWIRFAHGQVTFGQAVQNSKILIKAARDAGLSRIVHISITGASPDSPLPYFKGKGRVEEAIKSCGLSWAIIRPTVVFGKEDILINNLAWLLRRYPLFPIPGSGNYRLQPVFVEDLAHLAATAGAGTDNTVFDAAGPDIFTFNDLVRLIAATVGSRAKIIHLGPSQTFFLTGIVGKTVGDVVLTRDEIDGLAANLLFSRQPPTGQVSLRTWLAANSATVGQTYASELDRHYRPEQPT